MRLPRRHTQRELVGHQLEHAFDSAIEATGYMYGVAAFRRIDAFLHDIFRALPHEIGHLANQRARAGDIVEFRACKAGAERADVNT